MSLSVFLPYFGGAVAYAAAALLVGLGALRLIGRAPGWRVAPAAFLTLFFIALTQHPFPDPGSLECPVASATPQLQPFDFLDAWRALWARGAPPLEWVANRVFAASTMNYLLLAMIGFALSPLALRFRAALAFGVGLTCLVEATQLTGVWGLFPCAYRQFNVDDLILNSLGVISGFLFGRMIFPAWRTRG